MSASITEAMKLAITECADKRKELQDEAATAAREGKLDEVEKMIGSMRGVDVVIAKLAEAAHEWQQIKQNGYQEPKTKRGGKRKRKYPRRRRKSGVPPGSLTTSIELEHVALKALIHLKARQALPARIADIRQYVEEHVAFNEVDLQIQPGFNFPRWHVTLSKTLSILKKGGVTQTPRVGRWYLKKPAVAARLIRDGQIVRYSGEIANPAK